MKKQPSIQTLGELKQSGYAPKSLKTELRTNLIHHMERGTNPFSGIIGYDETVLPDVQRAIVDVIRTLHGNSASPVSSKQGSLK